MGKPVGVVDHHARLQEELGGDPEFRAEFLRAAREEVGEPGGCEGLLLALRLITEVQMQQTGEQEPRHATPLS